MKRVLVGRPRATGEMDDTLLSKKLALPVFASDPLSSVAYATESGLVGDGVVDDRHEDAPVAGRDDRPARCGADGHAATVGRAVVSAA